MTSLLFPEGSLCQWCRCEPPTTLLYGWATCIICAGSRTARIKRWLSKPWSVVPKAKA